MAVTIIARASVTLTQTVDISSVTWYYKLQASTASPPSKPTTNPPPTGWETTEPTYTEGSTNSLYICELTTFSDGTWSYSDVSLSSSYEAAKVAYNKSVATKQALDNMEIGGTNLWIVRDQVSGYVHSNQKSVVAGSAPNWPICSDYIPVTEGETLVVQQWIPNNTATDPPSAYYGFYPEKSMANPVMSSRGTFGGSSGDTYLSQTITVPTGAKYLRISLRSFGNPDSKIKIERGNMPTSWSPAPEDVSAEIANAIDDISVGGRNLLRGAAEEFALNEYKIYMIPTTEILEDTSYILQLWGVTLDEGSTGIKPYWGGGTIDMSPTNALMPDENGYICIKWTPTAANLAHVHAQNKRINLYNYPNGHTGYRAKVERWKLEKGDIPTAWSQAPEDGPGDGINLIINTLSPNVSAAAKYPRLKGQVPNTGGRGTATVAEHGIRFTNTTANWPFIRFGNSVVTTLDLLGLEPGEIYTYSGEVDFKVFSGSPAAATEYVFGVFIYGHRGSDSSNSLLQCHAIHRYTVSDLTDRGTEFTGVKFAATFAIPPNVNKLYIDIRGGTESGGTTASHHAVGDYIEVRNMKIERGNTATDWSPAPEDVEAEINNALTSANGKNKNYYSHSNATPTGNLVVGDTWFVLDNSDNVCAVKQWDGLGWVDTPYTSGIFSSIDAGKITTGELSANRVRGGLLVSLDGKTYFDLANNTIRTVLYDITGDTDLLFSAVEVTGGGVSLKGTEWLNNDTEESEEYNMVSLYRNGLIFEVPIGIFTSDGKTYVRTKTAYVRYINDSDDPTDRYGSKGFYLDCSDPIHVGQDETGSDPWVSLSEDAVKVRKDLHAYGQIEIFDPLTYDTWDESVTDNYPHIDFHEGSTDPDYLLDFTSRLVCDDGNQLTVEHTDGSKTQFRNGNIELYSATGLIDFHFGINHSGDYSSRIRETSSGVLKSYPSAITSGSDEALKKDILPIDARYLELIDKLEPKEFRFKDSPEYKHLGFIAQDVDDILDEIGIEDKPLVIPPMDEDDYYALDYQQIIPALVAYCQDLRKEINELKSRLGE